MNSKDFNVRPLQRYRTQGLIVLSCIALGACSGVGPQRPIPALDHFSAELADYDPSLYRVRRGESLAAIAWRFQLDERQLAQWNNLKAPYALKPGQRIRLNPPATGNPSATAVVTTQPVTRPAVVQRPVVRAPVVAATPPAVATRPLTPSSGSAPRALPVKPLPAPVSSPVSDNATANPGASVTSGAGAPSSGTATTSSTAAPPDATSASESQSVAVNDSGSDLLNWAWPAKGRVSKGSGGNVGIQIAGSSGQAVYAAASGRVVYSGNSLKGYGELIIIKHSDNILSAYAHSSKRLIEEGLDVVQGQQIAEMGAVDGHDPYVYFEIRQNGQPVDPTRFLPES